MDYTNEIKEDYKTDLKWCFNEDVSDFISKNRGDLTKEDILDFVNSWEFRDIDEWYEDYKENYEDEDGSIISKRCFSCWDNQD